MKKVLSVLLIALLALTVLAVTGVRLFRYFAADQIMENGGTMNPDDMDETETPMILDGDYTYADNEMLLQVITGTWSSEDGQHPVYGVFLGLLRIAAGRWITCGGNHFLFP